MPVYSIVASLLLATQAAPEGMIVRQFWNGNDLHRFCSTTSNDVRYDNSQMICLAYTVGAVDGSRVYEDVLNRNPLFCTGGGVEAGQLRHVVAKFLSEHPEQRHLSASGLVLTALSEAFPCEEKK